ncbi:hypothetical protein CRE_04134 [Caenorhabditis remanei]|uniref:Skp1-related protein n=1 Tax=Caenorhabditis remanei TaxID=31234 RepID=E3MN24_CAERE|nr:hypothetical protein CRE_04134 [Caenorhabditis remanei]
MTSPASSSEVKYLIESSEGNTFDVSGAALRQSNTFNAMFLNIGADGPIPFTDYNEATLKKVFEYCEHSVNEENYSGPKHQDDLSKWDLNFFNEMDQKMFIDVINASNFLDIERLTSYCCERIARMLRGKNTQEMIKVITLPTAEELEAKQKVEEKKAAAAKKVAEKAAETAEKTETLEELPVQQLVQTTRNKLTRKYLSFSNE